MTRQEFIEQLRIALSGKVGSAVINENVQYYEDYINTQIRNGKTEEEVLKDLGDPRLIAKSISEVQKNSGTIPDDTVNSEESAGKTNFPRWLVICIILLIAICVLGLLFSVLYVLLPVIIPVAVVLIVIRYFQKNA